MPYCFFCSSIVKTMTTTTNTIRDIGITPKIYAPPKNVNSDGVPKTAAPFVTPTPRPVKIS